MSLHRLFAPRWRHALFLLPLGLAVGLVVGLLFRDLLFAVAVGGIMGAGFGLLLALRRGSRG
jgi:hypothetical protein